MGTGVIYVQLPPADTFPVEFKPGETTSQLVQRIKDQMELEIRGLWDLRDTSHGGRTMSAMDEVMDDRVYYLTATVMYPHKTGLVRA